jgi:Ca-activated chloride channel family protein
MVGILPDITFHLLRPWWLLAILPALVFAWILFKRRTRTSGWAAVIDSELLAELLDNPQQSKPSWPVMALILAWLFAALALAGPCFEKNNQVALKQDDAVVILLDLSPSMLSQDVQPSRLQAAHYKILDLLRQRREGYTGLIAYSGSAHVVAPLSDDTNTIAALVSTLEPRIMPSIGSRVEDAVSEALQLLQNSHFNRGRLLLLTDGVVPEALANIQKQLDGHSVELNVIGIGTADGAPIRLQSGFVKDKQGNILMNPLDEKALQTLAQDNGGYYSTLRTDDKDIAPLIAPPDWLTQLGNGDPRRASHTVENWQDSGYWLALPCLLLVLLLFRRGVLLCLLPILFLTYQPPVRADALSLPETWQDWWQTPDQQAAKALEIGDSASAARQFMDPQWKAYAEYQSGQHDKAAEHFATSDSAAANYNRGNAQAHAGDLQGAIESYEQSLKKQPDLADAAFNRDLVKKLLDQKKQDQQQDQKNQQQDQQQQDQQQQDQQQQDQQRQDQQRQDQQRQDQQQNPENNNESSGEEKSTGQDKSEEEGSDTEKSKEKENETEDKKISDPENPDEKNQDSIKDKSAMDDGRSRSDIEKQQATEQWLRKVPDDPGGLLKNKFEYYYQLNRQQQALGRGAGLDNNEEQRW